MRIYFDACALLRLIDDAPQLRLQEEVKAVEFALDQVFEKNVVWIASEALFEELRRNPHLDKRELMLELLLYATETWKSTPFIELRAESLATLGYGTGDAAHLAMAEAAKADFLLTTDDRL